MNNPIGVIDSGVGGLSIASKLIEKLPNESFIYLADSKNLPYGVKSNKEIYSLTKKMIGFLLTQEIKLLVIACNTITVTCIDSLRVEYPNLPIVGIVPVIKTAVEKTKKERIGIYSTLVTARSKYQENLIKQFSKGCFVLNLGSSELASLVENLNFSLMDKVLKKELRLFKNANIDALALGCSHFPLIEDKKQRYLPGVLILDSSDAVCRQAQRILVHNNLVSKNQKPSYNFYTTGELKAMEYFTNKLTIKARIERISLQ